jgi:hypothetical protein
MPKVVINRCFGGFGLSDQAFGAFLLRKGIDYEIATTYGSMSYFYKKGHVGDDEYYISPYDLLEDRSDHDLIAVVEEMGEDANGFAADLRIVDIPDDVRWHINEYDGLEHVAEDHRTWS